MRNALVLLLALMILASGCLGEGGKTQSQVSPPSGTQSNFQTSGRIVPSQTQTAEKVGFSPLMALKRIERFSYVEKATVSMNITVSFANGSRSSELAIMIKESGYVDFKERIAQINTTTTTLPDNVTVTLIRTVINGTAYVSVPTGGFRRVNDSYVWRTNPVTIAMTLVKSKPPIANYTENGTLVLVYSAKPETILPLAELYFTGPKMNMTITDATVVLYFMNGAFAGERLIYSMVATGEVSDPVLGKIRMKQLGEWEGVMKITSINEERKVEIPEG